jgi:hypothetical protein
MRYLFRLLLLAPLAGAGSLAMAIEQPRYEVIGRDGDVEIRSYAPYLVAETFVPGSFEAAGNEGFRRLFRYITGANTARAGISMTAPVSQQQAGTEIAMTAPVAQSEAQGGHWVAFMVPSSFTPQTVPQPTDARVRIREVPAQLVAVARYSGFWGESRYRREEQRLLEQVGARGLTVTGEAQFARYNPPYMPPFLRRNEILVPVVSAAALAPEPGPGQAVPLAAN